MAEEERLTIKVGAEGGLEHINVEFDDGAEAAGFDLLERALTALRALDAAVRRPGPTQ